MHAPLEELMIRHPALVCCRADLEAVFALLCGTFRNGGTLWLCGNGGSAADCEHISGELLKGFEHRRPLSESSRVHLPEDLATALQQGLPAIPLTSFLSLTTAFSNDVAPRFVYAQLINVLAQPGDALLGISTSGNAENVKHAMMVASARGVSRIGLTGADGGTLAKSTDICIRVPEQRTRLVQELHQPVYHCLCLMLERFFYGIA
jgi:D-sedoheptulose 7-phosphate isomerase